MISRLLDFFKKLIINNKCVHRSAIVWGENNLSIGKNSRICEYSILRCRSSNITIGDNSDVGPFTAIFSGEDGVFIGDDVLIAPHCVIASGNHKFDNISIPMRKSGGISKGPIIIEDDVWIGANCTIMTGVTISKGSVIGANSVVTRDTKPNSVNYGSPAKFIRYRT